MGIHIDEGWEYFTPDPEIEWAVCTNGQAARVDGIGHVFDWRSHRAGTLGLRFGRGNPDYPRLRLAREKLGPGRKECDPVQCRTCGEMFPPGREGRKYCSMKCTPHPGRKRELPDGVCPCGATFRIRNAGQRFCGHVCAGKTGGPKVRAFDETRFRELFATGTPVAKIMAVFGISKRTVRRWREALGIPARPTGNHSRRSERRVAAGQA